MEIILPAINTDYTGYSSLVEIFAKINQCSVGEDLVINMPNWFAANMCSPFGAILNLAGRKVGSVRFNVGNPKVLEILKKNNFLPYICGVKRLVDIHDSTIIYRQFFRREDIFFKMYIESDLMRRIPPMSGALNKEFKNSLFEIFENANIHSETNTIFVCGQVFHNKKNLDFSITDVGVGFHKNITQNTGLPLMPDEAIKWALEGNTTTKKGPIPGGLGLKIIKEFINLNEGKMQIASDYGYWEFSNGEVKTETLKNRFPGSVVNIGINISDSYTHRPKREIQLEDIF